MRAILGTIALEPNRWTAYHEPRTDLLEVLPQVRAAGFDKLEVWQWHVTLRCLSAIRALKGKGDELGVQFVYIGVYPSFTASGVEGREQMRIQADILDKAEILGTSRLKVMLGCGLRGGVASPEQIQLTAERLGGWYNEAKRRGIGMCMELHGGTMFDPIEAGEKFMRDFPALDFTICYQPADFADTEKSLALADRFAGRISHIHLQAPQFRADGVMFDLLENGTLDYRRLLPHIVRHNPGATMTLEFVKDCIRSVSDFDLAAVLANARRDAEYVEGIMEGNRP